MEYNIQVTIDLTAKCGRFIQSSLTRSDPVGFNSRYFARGSFDVFSR